MQDKLTAAEMKDLLLKSKINDYPMYNLAKATLAVWDEIAPKIPNEHVSAEQIKDMEHLRGLTIVYEDNFLPPIPKEIADEYIELKWVKVSIE